MHLIGRWQRVRPWHVATNGFDAPLMLDRKWGRLSPFHCDEWHRLRDGRWIKPIAGGAFSSARMPARAFPFMAVGTVTQNTVALDSAYTFNSAGDGVALKFVPPWSKTLALAYYYITATTGTAANINDLDFELRNDDGGGLAPNRSSPTLHTSASMDPNGDASVTGWHQFNPADVALTAGTLYWAIVADADGNGTDFATLFRGLSGTLGSTSLLGLSLMYTATNGFSTNPTITNDVVGGLLLEMDDGTMLGNALVTDAASTSSTNRRGLYVGGLTEQLSIIGIMAGTATANYSGIEIYDSSTNPGGTTLASGSSMLVNASGEAGHALATPYTLAKATPYRVVLTYSSASTAPRKLSHGTQNGYGAKVREGRPGGSGWYWAEANGTTNWANDDQDGYPHVTLLIEDQVAVTGGSGVTGVVRPVHGGVVVA